MKRMTDDVKWIIFGGQKQIKRLPWLDLEKLRMNAVTEAEDIDELNIQVQVEAEAVEVKIDNESTKNGKGRRKRKGRKKRPPRVVHREVQTEDLEPEEPPSTPDLSALPLPELPKTPNCAWVHPGCKVELRGVPIHEVMRTKTTLQCWCGQKPMIEITTQTCLLAEEQNTWTGEAQSQELRVGMLPLLNVARPQGTEHRRKVGEGEWAAGKVRLPPIAPTNSPLSWTEEPSGAASKTSLLSLCSKAGSGCSSVKCAERRRRGGGNAPTDSGDYTSPLSAASSIPLSQLLPLDAVPPRGASWPLPTSPHPPRTPSF